MSLEILIKEFNPALLRNHARGKFILCKDNSEEEKERKKLLFYGHALDGKVKSHLTLAEKYELPEKSVLGGAEMRLEHQEDDNLKLYLFEFSGHFGGVPQPIAAALIPVLRQYLNQFDYETAEKAIYDERFDCHKKIWDTYQQDRHNYEQRNSEIESLYKNRWNVFRAYIRAMSKEEYAHSLGLKKLEEPQKIIGLSEEPQYNFQPKMKAEKITIAEPHILIASEDLPKWKEYLESC